MPSAQDQSEEITIKHGRFRVSRRYDPAVRIPDAVLKCVGFIGEVTSEDGTEVYGDLHATGFIVSIPSELPGDILDRYAFFVTAKHVASDLGSREIYFLVNKKGGGIMRLSANGRPWFLHPTDKTADVAIISVDVDPEADIMGIMVEDFVSADDLANLQGPSSQKVGVGDEVFATGLFTAAPGSSRILPIVRHGNLAMIPSEQIETEIGYADVYLVEARSIGGLSGSPVWVRTHIQLVVQHEGILKPANVVGPGKFLGLMHGHWDIKESEINNPLIVHDRKRGVNLGIGIVVPASKIRETIYQPILVELRKEMEKMLNKRSIPGIDSAKPNNKEAEQTIFTKEDFEVALKKASRKIDQKSKP
jgi:hypothetical protein